jgi:hypothetical protein
MAQGPANEGHGTIRREVVLFTASFTLVGLVAMAIAGHANFLFLAIVSAAGIATLSIRALFPRRAAIGQSLQPR